jgi:hypothetical protein
MAELYFAINQEDKIIDVFESDNIACIQQAQKSGMRILGSDFMVIPDEAKKLLRVFNNKVVPKVSAVISINKTNVMADGTDEVIVSIALFDVQPQEKIDEIIVDIDGAEMPVDIDSNNKGVLIFSTKVKGLHIITIENDNIHCCPEVVIGE